MHQCKIHVGNVTKTSCSLELNQIILMSAACTLGTFEIRSLIYVAERCGLQVNYCTLKQSASFCSDLDDQQVHTLSIFGGEYTHTHLIL